MSVVRVLGIDPGYDIVGFGLIEHDRAQRNQFLYVDGGIIKTDSKADYWLRIQQIAEDMEALIFELRPDVCVIESLFFAKNTTTAMKVSQARGVIGAVAQKNGLAIFEYTPLQVKMALTGHGQAEKWQVQEMVKMVLELDAVPQPDDFADALAVAICYAQGRR